MSDELPFVDARDAAAGIDTAFGCRKSVTPDIGCQDLNIPGVGKRDGVRDGDGDRVRLLARGTSGTANAQRARRLPELSDVEFRQDPLFEGFENAGIAEERCFLSEKRLAAV